MPKEFFIVSRRPLNESDLGEVEYAHYEVIEGKVTLTTADGTPLKRGNQLISARKSSKDVVPLWSAPVGHDERATAERLLHSKVSSERRGSDFNRIIHYDPVGWR